MEDSSCTFPVSKAVPKCLNNEHQKPSGKAQNNVFYQKLKGSEEKNK